MQIIPDPLFAAFMTLPFFVTLVALNVILVKPLREYLEGRGGAIQGAREDAKQLQAEAEARMVELERRLTAAREAAGRVRAEHRARGLDAEREVLAAARAKADGEVAAALATISGEVDIAKAAIKTSARNLSVDMAGRVLGRGLSA